MPNVTIALDEVLLKASRAYARKRQTSLNALVRKLLEQEVQSKPKIWLEECFDLADRAGANSKGKKWTREELYR